APPRQGFYPVTPEKRENAEDAGQNSYRDLDPEQQDLVAPHAPSPVSTGVAGSWRLAWSPGLVLSRAHIGGRVTSRARRADQTLSPVGHVPEVLGFDDRRHATAGQEVHALVGRPHRERGEAGP